MRREVKKTIAHLIEKAQRGEDAAVQREALIELGYEKDVSVFPVLIAQLGDPNSSVQHAAVISLGRYGNAEAIEELVKPKILQSPVVNVRWAAVAAMGKLGDFHVIDHLLRLVDDSEWIVRNQAVTELKQKIREIIQCNDARCARILVRMLALEDAEIIDLVVEGFCELGGVGIDLLLDALRGPSDLMRKNAARTLGEMRSQQAVDALIERLNDPDWGVRQSAVEALGKIRNEKAIEPLVRRLCDNVGDVQQQASNSLVNFGMLSTVSLLNALAHEKNKFCLRAILLTLGDIKDPKAVPALITHLRNSYFVVRMAAVRALKQYGEAIVDALIPTLSFNQSDIQRLLKDAKDHDNPNYQLRAVKALGGLEDHRAVPVLKRLVQEGSPEVQEASEKALVQIGCAAWGRCGALIVLSRMKNNSLAFYFSLSLLDPSDNVRLEAVRALAKIGESNVIDPLVKAARKDHDPYIRFEAVRLLRRIGIGYPQVLDAALSALKDSNRDVRAHAARLLGNFQDDRSIKPLLKATADPNWIVRESAELGLINFSDKAVPQLIDGLTSRSWTTRFRAARLLGEIGDVRAVGPLEKLLRKKGEREKVRRVTEESLRQLTRKESAGE